VSEPLVTFKGWQGKWWKNIKPGQAALDAVLTVMPGAGVASTVGKRVAGKVARRVGSKLGKLLRRKPRAGHLRPAGSSRVTKGALMLGKTKLLPTRPGIGTVTRWGVGAGAAGAAAAAAAHRQSAAPAIRAGHLAGPHPITQPGSGVRATSPRTMPHSMPRSSSSTRTSPTSGSARSKQCGCPKGSRMMCFKRHHNPEAVAKRKARAKAARAKSKSKTAKRHAKEKEAVARRKRARALRKARKLLRRGKGHR